MGVRDAGTARRAWEERPPSAEVVPASRAGWSESSRPTSEGESEASEKESRHGGLAARAAKTNPQILSENPSVLSRRVSPSRVSVPPSRRAGRRLWLPLSRVRVEFPEPWRSLAARSPKSRWCSILTIARTYFENKIHG